MPRSMEHLTPDMVKHQLTLQQTVKLRAEEFARRIRKLMLKKGLRQSDLARLAFGSAPDPKTGYSVGLGRDRISSYVNGRQFPDDKNLKAIAKALCVSVAELTPDVENLTIEQPQPDLYIQHIPGSDRGRFKVDKEMDLRLIYQTVALWTAYEDARSAAMLKAAQKRKTKLTPEQTEENFAKFTELAAKQIHEIETNSDFGLDIYDDATA